MFEERYPSIPGQPSRREGEERLVDLHGSHSECSRERYDQRVLIWKARVEGVVAESGEAIWQAEHPCVPCEYLL